MKPISTRRPPTWRWATLTVATLLLVSLECNKPEEDPDPGNTETGEDLDPDEVIAIGIRPTQIRLDTATELDLKGHALTRDGGWYDTIGGTWTSADESIATIDAEGHLVPHALGTVEIAFSWEGLDAEPSVVEIVEPGRVEVTVVDWLTSEPLAGFQVAVSGLHQFAAEGTTDANGFVVLDGDFSGPITVTAWHEDGGYRHGSQDRVAARELRMALYPTFEGFGTSTMEGQIQFDEDEVVPGKVAIGLAVPSFYWSPIYATAKQLLGEYHELEGFNLTWELPLNVQINGLVDQFSGETTAGKRVVFAAGGAYELGTVLALAMALEESGSGAIFPTMTSNIEDLRVGYSAPIEFVEDGVETGITVDLETKLPLETWLDVAPPPAGHYWPDPILVLSWREYEDAGYVAVGFGTGTHPYIPEGDPPADDDDDDSTRSAKGTELEERIWVPVREAARDGVFEDVPTRHQATASENGMDWAERGTSVVSPPTTRERVRLPDFLGLVEIEDPDINSWRLNYTAPPGTDFLLVDTIPHDPIDSIGSWTMFTPSMDEVELPRGTALVSEHYQGTYFYLDAFSLEIVSFQSLVNAHDEPMNEMWTYINRRSYANHFCPGANFP